MESLPFFATMCVCLLDARVSHHLLALNCHNREDGVEWCGTMWWSHSFLCCYLELLCPHNRVVLEMGCCSDPTMRASLKIDHSFVSMDIDERLIVKVIQPFLVQESSLHAKKRSFGAMGLVVAIYLIGEPF